MKSIITYVLLITGLGLVSATVVKANLDTLELVQILFRHGDRTPLQLFPTDPNMDFWPDGFAQLTDIGKKQQYELGQFIRQRYNGFLNKYYDNKEILVHSTGTDRSLMSAECQLAGLYASSDKKVWNPDANFQPVPISSKPLFIDYISSVDAHCPKFKQSMGSKKIPEMEKIDEENADLYELLTNETGMHITGISGVYFVYDTLFCQKCHNISWASWVAPVWPRILELTNLTYKFAFFTPEQRRLRGGPLLGHMIENMDLKINGDLGIRKAILYSSHDSMLAAFLRVLDIYNNLQPQYASAVFVELHLTKSGHAVQIMYKNTTASAEPYVLTIPGCTALCPFEKLIKLTANSIPGNILEECKVLPETILNFVATGNRPQTHRSRPQLPTLRTRIKRT